MDYRPVAKRTRNQEALKFKQWSVQKKRKNKGDWEGVGVSVVDVEEGKSGGSARSRARRKGKERLVASESVSTDGTEDSEGVVEIDGAEEGGVNSVSSIASKISGLREVSKSTADVGDFDNVAVIDVDDSHDDDVSDDVDEHGNGDDDDDAKNGSADDIDDDDDVVEIIAEGGCFNSAHLNYSSLNGGSGMGSKVDCEGVFPIESHEALSSGIRMTEKVNVEKRDADDVMYFDLEDGLDSSGEEDDDDSEDGSESLTESSSQEDNDDPEDEDFDVTKSHISESCSSESSRSDGDESRPYTSETECKNVGASVRSRISTNDSEFARNESDERVERRGSEVEKRGSIDREGEAWTVEAGLKKTKVPEHDSVNDSYNHTISSNEVSQITSAAKLTPLHFHSEKKEEKVGTFGYPIPVDVEDFDSSLGNEDDGINYMVHEDGGGNGDDTHGGKTNLSAEKSKQNEQGFGESSKKKHGHAPRVHDILKILLDSIMEKGEVLLEDLVSSEEKKQSCVEASLPLKFTFGIKEPVPLEKSEYEKELEQLWEEFDFVLRSSEIGEMDHSMAYNIHYATPDVETDCAAPCSRGKHQLILDDQIGLKCKFCSSVILEIKYILPSLIRQPWGKSGRRDCDKEGQTHFDEPQFQDVGNESTAGFDPLVHNKGTVWDIIPGTRTSMYPHQREGFEFIWKNIAGGIYLDKLKEPTRVGGGSGCIISHAPGTGKTRLTIVFLKTYMELFPTCRPLIIAPRSMLLTWEEEFKKWKVDIPFHNLNKSILSGKENIAAVNFLRNYGNQLRSVSSVRMLKLYSWRKEMSILGISYRLFVKLVEGRVEGEEVRKILLELPGLLVLDEGHTPRNNQSLMWKSVSEIETERRIILSGTPFQNNFDELYNTFCLVRPKFVDRFSFQQYKGFEHKAGRMSRSERGKWTRPSDLVSNKLEELKAIIRPFVHVHKGSILQENLPGLRDSVVVLQPAQFQKSLLEAIQGRKNVLELGYFVSLISAHPSLFPDCWSSEKEEFFVDREKLESLRLNPDAGVKTKFLMELIRLSEALNEKVLVFSQYIDPLTLIMDQLNSLYSWKEGREVLYMDGKLDVKQCQASISLFNEPTSEVKVLLASTRACSEGINLVGASRVVLLDVVWNPSVERQAISRAYRIGQKKVVHIYHLITSGTMEGEKYCRQAEKDRVSEFVFSSTETNKDQPSVSPTVSEDKILDVMVHHEKLKCMFEKIICQPKESNLVETFGLVES